MRKLTIAHESWPLATTFTISRGSKTSAEVIVVAIEEDGRTGHGECVPYPRYGQTVESVMAEIEALRGEIESGLDRAALQTRMEAGAARNGIDSALWDLEAKRSGRPAWALAGLDSLDAVTTAYTLSLEAPEAMASAAAKAEAAGRPLLKLKLGTEGGDAERIAAVHEAAPTCRLVVDANEGWKADQLPDLFAACASAGVELIEQPLPAGDDEALRGTEHPIAVCADEAAHDLSTLDALVGKYDAINIKLDKTGGLTEALALADAAQERGLILMIGCMTSTSLSMAPAQLIAQRCKVVDLDGPLLLARDRENGIRYDGGTMHPAPAALWG